jgi:hypothetical protein
MSRENNSGAVAAKYGIGLPTRSHARGVGNTDGFEAQRCDLKLIAAVLKSLGFCHMQRGVGDVTSSAARLVQTCRLQICRVNRRWRSGS